MNKRNTNLNHAANMLRHASSKLKVIFKAVVRAVKLFRYSSVPENVPNVEELSPRAGGADGRFRRAHNFNTKCLIG